MATEHTSDGRGARTRRTRTTIRRQRWRWLALALPFILAPSARAQDPFADFVVSFTPGTGAGFGTEQLVLGPPQGGGELQGSLDVLSLGNGGVIVLGFDPPVICDGPGADLTVFENPFHSGTPDGPIFAEYGIVAVSQDGVNFVTFPYDPVTHVGLAGQNPVLSNPDNGISPLDPSVSGGDQFDLADVRLTWAKYVRITDPGATIDDPGNHVPPGTQAGFDLDALAALHACDPSALASATPTPTPTPSDAASPMPTVTAMPEQGTPTAPPTSSTVAPATPTASATSSPEVTATATAVAVLPGDVDGNRVVNAADLRQLIDELFDGDGDRADDVGGGAVHSTAGADVNGDGRITAADLSALLSLRSP